MAEMFDVKVVTPDRVFYEGQVSMVEMKTSEGEIGVYKNHIPLTCILEPGILRLHEADGAKEAAVHAGFVEILQEKVTILAEIAEWPEEIDKNRAEEAKTRAERRLAENNPEVNIARAEFALRKAIVRINLSK